MRKFLTLLPVLVCFSILAYSQSKIITGRVTDAQGQPVPFASVRIKGTKVGVASDADGNFTIKANGTETLVISGTGITTKEFPIANQNILAIQVTRQANNLTEVVVTSLGIRKEAKALGYSAVTINSEALNVSKPINVATGLIGQVSGAQISVVNNGVDPQIRVQLRGERHISADNEPLFIVDGMEVTSDFINLINPEDIENVSVLKSASAAALYGSEATNGVIIYTTKKGSKNGKFTVNLSQTVTAEHLAYPPALQNTYSGYGGENGTYLAGTPYQRTGINPYTGFTNYMPFENQSYGPAFNGSPANAFVGIPNAQGQVLQVPFEPQSKSVLQEFFKTGITTQTDVSVSSGDVKNSNFIGMQYADVKGITPDDEANRASVRFGGKRTLGIFSYDYNMSYAYKYTNVVGNDITAGGFPIYWTLLNTQANFPISQLKDWQDPNSFGNLNNYPNAYYINPWWQVANSRVINHYDNVQGALNLTLKPTTWFTASYRLSALVTNNIYKAYRNQATFTPFAQQNWGPPYYGTPFNGSIAGAEEDKTILGRRLQQDILLTFQKKFGDLSSTLIIGNTIWDRYANNQVQGVGNAVGDDINGTNPQTQTSGLFVPGLYNIANKFGLVNTGSAITSTGGIQGVQESRLIGYYSDLTLGYNDFIFLHGNFRRDYSSLLIIGNNAYNVYGGDVSWVFSENIPAIKNSNLFSYAKLRGAYSHTGQITLSPFGIYNTFSIPSPYPYGGLASLQLASNYTNPNNVPEATNELEAGFEFGMLQNRLTGGVTYYHDINSNQLFTVGLTSATGFGSASINAAQTTSHGWEFDLNDNVVRTKTWNWSMRSNFAINTTIVNHLFGSGGNTTLQTSIGNNNEAIVGMAFPEIYVQDFVRDPATGKVIVDPVDGMPSVSQNLIAAGRTTPKYILGLTSTLTFMQITLQVIADYRGGYVFYNSAEKALDFTGLAANTTANGRQNFIFPNSEVIQNGKLVSNTNTYVEDGNINYWAYFMSNQSIQTPYVENAAAWKIRTISLSYDFGKMLSNKMKFIKSTKLTLMCNNALMFRPKENNFTDPEFNSDNSNALGNNTYYQLPPTRQFTAIASFTF